MGSDFFTAQIFGAIAMAISILSWQIKNPKLIILCNLPACIFWGLQYVYLSATIGAITCFSTALKDGALYFTNEKQAKYLIVSFFIGTLALLIWNYKGSIDLLPISALIIYNIALYFYRDDRSTLSRYIILTKICWLIYCFNAGAYVGMTCSVLVMASSVIGMARHEGWFKQGMIIKPQFTQIRTLRIFARN